MSWSLSRRHIWARLLLIGTMSLSCAALLRAQTAPISASTAALIPREKPPSLPEYDRLLSRIDRLLGDSDRVALPLLEQAIAINAFDGLLHLMTANAYERVGNCGAAIKHRHAAMALGTTAGRGAQWIRIARCEAKSGRVDSAFAAIDSALAAGYEYRAELATLEDFSSLKKDPRWPSRVGARAADSPPRAERWRRDLDFFAAEARRLLAVARRGSGSSPAASASFTRAVDDLRRRIPTLTDERINLELQRLAVMLSDGHTQVGLRVGRVPIDLYWFADGLFVISTRPGTDDLYGMRVDSIGQMSAVEAMAAVAPFAHRDNDMGLLVHGPRLLVMPQVLHAIGATSDTGAATFVFRSRSGETQRRALRATARPARPFPLPMPRDAAQETAPFYLRDSTTLSIYSLPADQAFYIRYGEVARVGRRSMAQIADSIRTAIDASGASTIIFDIRQNTGGETALFPSLVTMLARVAETPGRQLYVIIGRLTFSAGQNLAASIEHYVPRARFIGEPSGSRPNFIGESTPIRLPYSGLSGTISSRWNQNTDFNDDRNWIQPELPAPLTSTDYFSGRDPAVEGILELVRQRGKRE